MYVDNLAFLCKQRDSWVDRWLLLNHGPDSRRMLQEYLLDGRHREGLPTFLVQAQEYLLEELDTSPPNPDKEVYK